MRRLLFASFLSLSLAAAAAESALAQLPHVHGSDADHSANAHCAVNQAHGIVFDAAPEAPAPAPAVSLYRRAEIPSFPPERTAVRRASRGPPALLPR